MLPLWLGIWLGLGLGLRWSLCLGIGYCTDFDLGFGFALRFGADLYCLLGFYFGFGSGLAPCAFALDLLSCKRKTKETTEHLQWMTKGDFTATTAPLLPPSMLFSNAY